jgi:hypothetical protein
METSSESEEVEVPDKKRPKIVKEVDDETRFDQKITAQMMQHIFNLEQASIFIYTICFK